MAKSEIFKNKLFAKILRHYNVFPVDRTKRDPKSLFIALSIFKVQSEVQLLIFTEGKVVKYESDIGKSVKNGATFSFCNTIGPSTSSKGYSKADIYDNNGNKKKGYGGGNCQVSSTLYNAVLAVPTLTVVERHPHSNHVPYVPDGKDAAVAYGSYDFKFRNDTGNDIKILSSVANGSVNITLMTLKTQ